MVKKVPIAIKVYLLSVTFLVVGMTLVAVTSSSMERNSIFLGFSAFRLILIIFFFLMSIVFSTITFRAFRSEKNLELQRSWLASLQNKQNRFLFIRDMLVLLGIFTTGLIYLRYKRYAFLSLIWEPLPNYIAVLVPYLAGFAALLLLSASFLQFLIYEKNGLNYRKSFVKQAKLIGLVLLIFLTGTGIYWGSANLVGHTITPPMAYFPDLAEAFTNGQIYLPDPPYTKDLSLYDGRYYVSFPPLAALLMIPKVASTSRFGINTVQFTIEFSGITLVLLFLILHNLREKNWITLNTPSMIWLVALFALGTAQWYMSTTGLVWHVAQILAITFLSFSILFALLLKPETTWGIFRSALLAGLALGLAMLSRPHLGLAWFFLIGLVAQITAVQGRVSWRRLLLWVGASTIPMILSVVGLGWYNLVRFGSVADFGYTYMLVGPGILEPLQVYGQMHPHFIWQNLKANWFGLPYWDEECQRLAPNRKGMSIFITTPGLILLYRSWKREIWLVAGWLSVALISFVHLLYFNTGGLQFGYRFSLDFLVIAFCLLAAGFKDRLPKYFPYLVLYSVVINYIGVLWNAKQWCITW